MCGIAGFNWNDPGLGKIMGDTLSHRGPDAEGVFSEDKVTLASRRLAVIDLSASANQPMESADGRYVITYNGEIYNFQELRRELESSYRFRTHSDTEVILAGYKIWGKEVAARLNGMFAFAIWDKEEESLFCARDQMGIKPFYYFWDPSTNSGPAGKFIFASEIKAILKHDIPRILDQESFNQYLRVLYVPEPRTMIKGISKLPPGSTLTLKDDALKIERFFVPTRTERTWDYDSAKKAVRESVMAAVKRQLVADVPVGIYLSGGIDSSTVLASVSAEKKNVKTFSIGFELDEGEEKEKFNRDFELARETSRHFGADHHPLTINIKDVADGLEEVIASIDDPISNPTAIPMAHLSRFAKREVTVALSGDGGDELFGGYERYRLSKLRGLLVLAPWIKGQSALDRLELFEFQKDPLLRRVVSKSHLKPAAIVKKSFERYIPSGNATEGLMIADLRSWLPDQALALGDRMSMRGSLEQRVPFLDMEVVNLSMSLPLSYKVGFKNTKKILKDAFRGDLPEELFREPKRGWFSPGAKWLRRPEIQRITKEILTSGYYPPSAGLFNWPAVHEVLDNHISKREYNLTVIWAILTFQIWARQYGIKSDG